MKRVIAAVALVLILVLAGIAALIVSRCLSHQQNRIRVGYIPFNADLPFFVALEHGLFKEEGLDIEPIRCGDSTEALNTMLAGQVDMVAGLTFSIFAAAEHRSPGRFKLFCPFAEEDPETMSYLLIRNDLHISSPIELRGKKVGTYTGATQLLYLKLFLTKAGLDPEKDVEIIQVSPNLQAQALAARRIDALFTVEPYGTIAIKEKAGIAFLTNPRSKYILRPFWSGASAVSTALWRRDPGAVRRICGAMNKAIDSIHADTLSAKRDLPKYTPVDEQTALVSGLYRWYKTTENLDFSSIQQLFDLMSTYGVVPGTVAARDLFLTEEELKR